MSSLGCECNNNNKNNKKQSSNQKQKKNQIMENMQKNLLLVLELVLKFRALTCTW